MRHSCGFIVFRRVRGEHDVQFLLQCRRDTIPYLVFLQGRYEPDEFERLWSGMTHEEHARIRTCSFRALFTSARIHSDCWEQSQRLYQKCYHHLLSLQDQDGWTTPEWGFPKGRKNHRKESDQACAMRELLEETGLRREQVQPLSDCPPLRERFQGSDKKWYTCEYYVAEALADPTLRPRPENDPEVSALGWFTVAEAVKLFRPWETYRKTTLIDAHHQLHQLGLCPPLCHPLDEEVVQDSDLEETAF